MAPSQQGLLTLDCLCDPAGPGRGHPPADVGIAVGGETTEAAGDRASVDKPHDPVAGVWGVAKSMEAGRCREKGCRFSKGEEKRMLHLDGTFQTFPEVGFFIQRQRVQEPLIHRFAPSAGLGKVIS